MKKAFVLCSGGIDSATCAFLAFGQADAIELISIDYGQRHKKEIGHARKIADYLCTTKIGDHRPRVQHMVLDIGDVLAGSHVMLTNTSIDIPRISYSEIEGVSPTFVPYRNGTLLAMVTAYAQRWVCQYKDWQNTMRDSTAVYFGAHADDALNWAYPDCTPEWTGAMANAIYVGTYHTTRLITPLQWLLKHEVIRLGDELGVPWEITWSCYGGGSKHCGVCPTCRARREGFRLAGVIDPTEYAEESEEL